MKTLKVEWSNYGPVRVVGPVYRLDEHPVGAEGKFGTITAHTSDWARVKYVKVSDRATMIRPKQSGHEIEGSVKIRGKTYSAFTSAGRDTIDDEEVDGMIIIRDHRTKSAKKHHRFK